METPQKPFHRLLILGVVVQELGAVVALGVFQSFRMALALLAGALTMKAISYVCVRKSRVDFRDYMQKLELTEKRLRQSEKMSSIGQLASGVAHEINNPLGVILGFAESALRRVKPGDAFEMPLQSIQREAIRCKNLVNDLLTFSRASKMEREPIDFNQALEGALSLIIAKAKTTQVAVKTELAARLPGFLGNANQIQQVIINLATNAIDAMHGKGTLTIRTELLMEGPLSWIQLKVSDTGSGIPAETLPHIFEPFYTTKPQGQGTGLGLALVQEIVRKHSALIHIESEPGHTEFSIKFPVRTGQEGTYGSQGTGEEARRNAA